MYKTNCMQSIENIFQHGKYLVAMSLNWFHGTLSSDVDQDT